MSSVVYTTTSGRGESKWFGVFARLSQHFADGVENRVGN